MAYDIRHSKWCPSLANICSYLEGVDVGINLDKKCYSRRNHYNSLFIPLYLTMIHLFLFVTGAMGQEGHQAPLVILPSEDFQSRHSLIDDGSGPLHTSSNHNRLSLVKRSTSDAALKSDDGTLENATTVREVSKAVDESKVTDLPVQTESDATKLKVSNESKDSELMPSAPVDDEELGHGPPSELNPEAMLRLFYVFVGIGVIVLIYLLIKFLRFRRKRASRKYRVLAHSDEQEMFPLAADDGDDEEIFNAADHQSLK